MLRYRADHIWSLSRAIEILICIISYMTWSYIDIVNVDFKPHTSDIILVIYSYIFFFIASLYFLTTIYISNAISRGYIISALIKNAFLITLNFILFIYIIDGGFQFSMIHISYGIGLLSSTIGYLLSVKIINHKNR